MSAPTLSDAKAVLSSVFGHPRFRPGQSAAVFSLLNQRDTLVVLPTGGGKSLCYQVPALVLPGLTIVVSPLISLMRDQVRTLRARKIKAAFINSSLTSAEAGDELDRAERGQLKLLYLAPERFEIPSVISKLALCRVSLLAVDEAHCISHWGHDFRPSYRRLADVRKKLGSPPVIALTATATPEVREDISDQLRLRRPTVIVTGFDRPNLSYSVAAARTDAIKIPLLANAIDRVAGSAIVYAATKRSVDGVSNALRAAGTAVVAYHAGMPSTERKRVQDEFMSGARRVIVATNAFGMGIDKPDVRLVVHHSMPGTLEAYYQEAGRAGRDGRQSKVLLLHSFADRFTHEFFIANSFPGRATVECVYSNLRQAASSDGFIPDHGPDWKRARGRSDVTPRQAESALRILERAGALELIPPENTAAVVRFTATLARLKRELSGSASPELALLRSLWRANGSKLFGGAAVDLGNLPPVLNGPAACAVLLDNLQRRQLLHWTASDGGVRLRDMRASLRDLAIDWQAIERRRLAELAKLNEMQKYAYARSCRRSFLLRYFGESPRRGKCGRCDNCATIL
jgi:ATP-dependent DNA helicase, RecQ family